MKNHWKNSFVGGTALLAIATFSLVAAAKLTKEGASTAGFHAKGPAGLKIDGKTSDLSVADDGTTVTITVPLGNIDTGIGLRNDHMRKALETSSFPNAELKVARGALKVPAAGAESSGDAKGTLKIHGQTKEVTFHYKAKSEGAVISIDGSTTIDMTQFGIKTPSYLGVGVKPDVEVFASFKAKDL
jgi:polyisoprenoid-binding protein YceI